MFTEFERFAEQLCGAWLPACNQLLLPLPRTPPPHVQQGAPHHAASGATVFGQQPQPGRDSTGRGGGNAGRGRGGSAGQQQAWGRGGAQRQQSPQQRRPQQQQQQQQHQAVPPAGTARSAPILSRLGSIGSGVGERLGFWGGGSGSSSKADAAPAAGRGRGAPTPARGGRSGRQGPQLSSGRGASSWTRSASQQQQQQQVAVAGPQGRGGRSLRGLRGGGRLGARGAAAAQTAPGRGVSSQGTAAAQGLAASSVWGQSGGEGGAAGAPTWAGNDMADMEADDDAGDGDGAWGHEPDGDGDWEQQQDADGDEEAEEEEQEEEEQEPVEEEEEEQDGGGVMGLDQLDEGGGGADRGTATSPALSTAQLRAARSAAAAAMAHGSAAPTGAGGYACEHLLLPVWCRRPFLLSVQWHAWRLRPSPMVFSILACSTSPPCVSSTCTYVPQLPRSPTSTARSFCPSHLFLKHPCPVFITPHHAAGALSQPEASAAAAPRPFRAPGGAVGAQQQQHLLVTPRCEDMCPQAERAQRTADRQLHEYERLPGDTYATSAALAVKKYTRSGAAKALKSPEPQTQASTASHQQTG
jgi:SAC3/GANP family